MAATSVMPQPSEFSFDEFLQAEIAKDILRFTTAGSVDDGKSTLIGRLLYDSRNFYDDQLESVTKASIGRNAGTIDFSLFTDGLRAEREQGITIDVAYRYFSTPKRKFIIADTPGHEQYTRNMVTGASTAELAIVLVDARKGVLTQSRRHASIASLLALPHLVVAINKMDLVDYDEQVFAGIESDFREFLAGFSTIDPYFIPISALAGDNVVMRSGRMPWFQGKSLIEHLETVRVGERLEKTGFRFPVQRVVRPDLDFRGYAGQIAGGSIRVGDKVSIFPSGRSTRVKGIVTFDGDLTEAQSPQSVTLTLDDEIDIVRGDLIASIAHWPRVANQFEATIVWLSEHPLDVNRRYRLKHSSHQEWATVADLKHRININTLEHEEVTTLEMNSLGVVRIETARPLYLDAYQQNRQMGSFILIDAVSNATVAAGMIADAHSDAGLEGGSQYVGIGRVSLAERITKQKHSGAVITLGNREAVAVELERLLFDHGCSTLAIANWQHDWRNVFAESTLLVIALGTQADTNQVDDFVSGDKRSLPQSTGSAREDAQTIYEFLKEQGIVHHVTE